MRIEITTGGITSVLPVFGFESLIDSGIDDVEKVLSGFKTGSQTGSCSRTHSKSN